MPTNRTRRLNQRRHDVQKLDFDCREELLHGGPMFDGGGFQGNVAAFKRAWEIHGERLTAEHIKEHPCTRPFAWWVLTHRHERPIIIRDYPGDLKEWESLQRAENMFGYLHTQCYGGPDFSPFQEEESDYLARHGLLSAAERSELARMHDGIVDA